MLKALFFDLDDTLCDSSPAWHPALATAFNRLIGRYPQLTHESLSEAWNEVHAEHVPRLSGGQISMAQLRDLRFPETLARLDVLDTIEADAANNLLSTARLDRIRPFPGVLEMLDRLSPRYHLAIVTNGAADDHMDSQVTLAGHVALDVRVARVHVSDAVGARKPDARIFAAALRSAGVEPFEALHVGDSPGADVLGANRAGLVSVLVTNGKPAPEPKSDDERPDHVISRITDIEALLDTL